MALPERVASPSRGAARSSSAQRRLAHTAFRAWHRAPDRVTCHEPRHDSVHAHRTRVGLPASHPLPHRRRALPRACGNPAHHRLRHHRLGKDGADLRPRRPDPRARRALRHLRQDGQLHPVVLRHGPRHPAQPPRRPRAAVVALPGGAFPARLRHDGRGAHPAAEATCSRSSTRCCAACARTACR